MIENKDIISIKDNILDLLDKMSYIELQALGLFIVKATDNKYKLSYGINDNNKRIYTRTHLLCYILQIAYDEDELPIIRYDNLFTLENVILGFSFFQFADSIKDEINNYYCI